VTLQTWLLQELDDLSTRLTRQVLDRVPLERRSERPGGGNSIAWTSLHIARHAQLALSVLGRPEIEAPVNGGEGLDEVESWSREVSPARVEAYVTDILADAARYVAAIEPAALDMVPDAEAALARAAVPRERYAWLYDQWSGQPAAFFVRWPVIGHAINHVGEMIATRNRIGLSPYQ
jgi:hypothetical protein